MLRIPWPWNNSSPSKCGFLCALNWFIKLSYISTLFVFNSCGIESISGFIEENLLFFLCNHCTCSSIDIVNHDCLRNVFGLVINNQWVTVSLGV